MSKKINIKLEPYQSIHIHEKKDGSKIPCLVQEIYAEFADDPLVVSEVTLENALNTMMGYRTLVGGSITPKEKENLLADFDAILEVVQSMKNKAREMPTPEDIAKKSNKKKKV